MTDASERRKKDEEWKEIERRYHENRRRAEARGELRRDPGTRASACCNAGILWSKQAVVCKKCGERQ